MRSVIRAFLLHSRKGGRERGRATKWSDPLRYDNHEVAAARSRSSPSFKTHSGKERSVATRACLPDLGQFWIGGQAHTGNSRFAHHRMPLQDHVPVEASRLAIFSLCTMLDCRKRSVAKDELPLAFQSSHSFHNLLKHANFSQTLHFYLRGLR